MTGDPQCRVCGGPWCFGECLSRRLRPDPFEIPLDPFSTIDRLEELLDVSKVCEAVEDADKKMRERKAMPVPSYEDLVAYLTAYLGDPVFARRFADCMQLIRGKNSDYTQGQGKRDRIAHFREAAKELELPMLKIWQVFVRKHWAVIQKFANGGVAESEPIDGRINDVINYMVLFGAIIEDIESRKTADDNGGDRVVKCEPRGPLGPGWK